MRHFILLTFSTLGLLIAAYSPTFATGNDTTVAHKPSIHLLPFIHDIKPLMEVQPITLLEDDRSQNSISTFCGDVQNIVALMGEDIRLVAQEKQLRESAIGAREYWSVSTTVEGMQPGELFYSERKSPPQWYLVLKMDEFPGEYTAGNAYQEHSAMLGSCLGSEWVMEETKTQFGTTMKFYHMNDDPVVSNQSYITLLLKGSNVSLMVSQPLQEEVLSQY